jgi:hypothetical protein
MFNVLKTSKDEPAVGVLRLDLVELPHVLVTDESVDVLWEVVDNELVAAAA